MLNLIKLEIKKNKFKGNLLGVLIANLVIASFIILIYFNPGSVELDGFMSYQEALSLIDTFVRATFIIFSAVLLAKFVIEEYKTKTISLMFTYPVNRKKIILAKLIIVGVWTFLAIVISNIIIASVFLTIDNIWNRIPELLERSVLEEHALRTMFNAIAAAGMCLVPLCLGMIKKSLPTTIVSSIIIVSLLNSSNGSFSLSSIIAIPVGLAVIGVFIAYMTFRNIDKVDLT